MKKHIAMALACACVVLSSAGCTSKYDAEDFVGKTSAEIIDTYGTFNCVLMPASEDGLYRNCRCGYTMKEPKAGFLGTSAEELFFITFDENGIAIQCEEGYRPGG